MHRNSGIIIHLFIIIGTTSKTENGTSNVNGVNFEDSGAAPSGPPEEELLMWKPASIKDHNLEILRKQVNQKHGDANLENYYDLHM